jgi:hypothetical protein
MCLDLVARSPPPKTKLPDWLLKTFYFVLFLRLGSVAGREVHRRAGLVLDPYLDAWRIGEIIEDLRGLTLLELLAVDPFACERSDCSCSLRRDVPR